MTVQRRYPAGAEVVEGGVSFRVWAPNAKRVDVVLDAGTHALASESGSYYSGVVEGAKAGDRYRYRLDGGDAFADPVSRYQPEGPHGPSQIVDLSTFHWNDGNWNGVELKGRVIYEMHIGTFTREGTWAAAQQQLKELADAGIDCLEIMPINEFAGTFGWGYDGVNLFAPTRNYGEPDDVRRFIDAAHALGVSVILDVVYNHFGPDGNYMWKYGPYDSLKHKNEWGNNVNYDGPGAAGVREFVLANAAYWIDEFHFDGLRLDATQAILDDSPRHILSEIGEAVFKAGGERATFIVNENESQEAKMVRPVEKGGYGLDGMWNDDFHHSAMVALTGKNEAYYTDHFGNPQEFVSAAKYGYLFQGQRYSWQEQRRGTPAFDLAPWRFVNFIQNHDQIANTGRGLRCCQLTSPGRYRAMTAVMLLFPGTPMLFMGQEFAANTPFHYFADHVPELAKLVHEGRTEFMRQFRSLDRPDLSAMLPEPHVRDTFERCKLDFADRTRNAPQYRLHKDLLKLRKADPAFHSRDTRSVDGAVLGPQSFVLRYFGEAEDRTADRLLLVNFGRDLHLDQTPEPLLAPAERHGWNVLWSTEAVEYGGDGVNPPETIGGWRIPGESATVLAPVPETVANVQEKIQRAKAESLERKRRERTRLGT